MSRRLIINFTIPPETVHYVISGSEGETVLIYSLEMDFEGIPGLCERFGLTFRSLEADPSPGSGR